MPGAGSFFTLSGSHDIPCRISFSALLVRPISGDPSAGAGGNIAVTWRVPGLGESGANGGVVIMAASTTATASGLIPPPTDTLDGMPSGAAAKALAVALGVIGLVILPAGMRRRVHSRESTRRPG